MIDLLLRIGISNLCVSLVLSIAAWTVQKSGKRPLVAHLLWLFVLAKLVTPPLLTLPVVAVPGLSGSSAAAVVAPPPSVEFVAASDPLDPRAALVHAGGADLPTGAMASSFLEQGKAGLVLIWLLGSLCVLIWSLLRVWRFHRLLGMASEPAPAALQDVATGIARRLGLAATPAVYTAAAQLPPMVWWVGGGVRVVLPAELPRDMERQELHWVLAHELAHVRRRDHMVRWLEWLACVGFWWNPVAWWARRNLRVNEEVCCDALVLSSLRPDPHTYANSLLNAVEFLTAPALRPPAMASGIDSGGFLERRLKMIVSNKQIRTTPRWLHASLLLCALGLMPLGVAYAQDPHPKDDRPGEVTQRKEVPPQREGITVEEYERFQTEIREQVAAGEITSEEAARSLMQMRKQVVRKREGITPEQFEERVAAMRRMLANGEMTREDFARHVAAMRGRIEQKAITREEYARAEAEIKQAVAEGRVSADDAKRRLAEMRELIGRGDGGITREEYARAVAEIEWAVAEGKLTREEAERKLIGLREKIARRDDGITREEYARAEAEIKQAVAEGRVSPDDAKRRLAEMRELIGRGGDGITREEYARAVAEIEWAVAEGKLTREEAERKLIGLREKIARRDDGITREEYARAEAEIKQAVAEGRVSPDDAKRRLAEMRELIGRGGDGITREDYARAAEKIEQAVAEGELTQEEAERKLIQLRQEIRRERGGFTLEEYQRAEGEMWKAVAEGRMSAEDAERRLLEMWERVVDEREQPDSDKKRGTKRRDL